MFRRSSVFNAACKLARLRHAACSGRRSVSRQRMDCGGLPLLWQMGPGGTGPSVYETGGTRSTASAGGTPSTASLGPGWNRAFQGSVTIGPGWDPALDWAMSLGGQPFRSFVGGGGGAVVPRARCCSVTAPASRRTPSASRVWGGVRGRGSAWTAAARFCWQCACRPVVWAGDRKPEQVSRLGRVGFRTGGGRVLRSGHAGFGPARGSDLGERGQRRGKRVRKRVARPAGFEPATTCLEGRCSVQLSYGRPSWEAPGRQREAWGAIPACSERPWRCPRVRDCHWRA